MKNYTAINEYNVHYSFKAYNDEMAKDFATHKFSTPFKRIIIIENTHDDGQHIMVASFGLTANT